MALFRFAKRSSYGLLSASGMFLGHYVAWICAGMMGVGAALILNTPLARLDSGDVAYQTLGWAGVLAVVAAGWTTANPTLYRAGLALQAVTPDWSRSRVTLATGVVTSLIACFPFVFTKLLDFVGLYGLLLAPAGAIVVAEHWIFPKLGLTRYWTSNRGSLLNWPALVCWLVAVALALVLERTGTLHLFYLAVPVYLFTLVLYILLASLAGAKEPPPASFREAEASHSASAPRSTTLPAAPPGPLMVTSGIAALAALLVCLAVSLQVALGGMTGFDRRLAAAKNWLAVATLVYFVFGTVFYRLWRARKEFDHA
jgi:NCS1 family nucleobase:cation symporter-1